MVTEKYARVVNPSASRIYLNMIERYLYSMPIKFQRTITLLTAALVIIAVTVFMGMMSAVGQQVNQPQELQPFTSQMSGTEEVPPVDTTATGTAEFNLGTNGIDYQASVSGISGVTAAHIHSGNVGENGPVIVTLFKSDTPSNQTNGVLVKGTITAADLEGPMQGKQFSDLVSAMSSGGTYVNVHTEANPNGEIRGQI
jgi:hypothetical protein